MLHKQKEVILLLVKHNQSKKNWESRYWFLYKDFLNPADAFTDFSCERHDGKLGYIALIESLLNKDRDANIFVEVYGMIKTIISMPILYLSLANYRFQR